MINIRILPQLHTDYGHDSVLIFVESERMIFFQRTIVQSAAVSSHDSFRRKLGPTTGRTECLKLNIT